MFLNLPFKYRCALVHQLAQNGKHTFEPSPMGSKDQDSTNIGNIFSCLHTLSMEVHSYCINDSAQLRPSSFLCGRRNLSSSKKKRTRLVLVGCVCTSRSFGGQRTHAWWDGKTRRSFFRSVSKRNTPARYFTSIHVGYFYLCGGVSARFSSASGLIRH